MKGHNNYMKTADQRRTLPAVTNATTGAKCNKGAIRNNPQQGIGTKSKVLRKRNYIKGGIPYIDIHIGSLPYVVILITSLLSTTQLQIKYDKTLQSCIGRAK